MIVNIKLTLSQLTAVKPHLKIENRGQSIEMADNGLIEVSFYVAFCASKKKNEIQIKAVQ